MQKDTSLRDMLRQHITASHQFQMDMKETLAEIKVHGEYTKRAVEDHEDALIKLIAARNKQKGAVWILSIMGGTSFIAIVKILLHL